MDARRCRRFGDREELNGLIRLECLASMRPPGPLKLRLPWNWGGLKEMSPVDLCEETSKAGTSVDYSREAFGVVIGGRS